jgi:NitT/TauT family transport system ATP-binding protein
MQIMDKQISFQNVSLVFDGPNSNSTIVFQDLCFDVNRGEFVSIIGPSGCGKTSVQKMICGLLAPSSGKIIIDGLDPMCASRKRLFSYVFQNPVLLRWRTIRQNILLPAEIANLGDCTKKVNELLQLVGLNGFGDAYPNMLSGGMQSRVQIARALLLEPKGLALDECFGDLDELTRTRMNLELLRIWHYYRPTIVFVTHSIEEAIFLSDRILVFGQRPTGIIESFLVNLPRPREIQLMDSPEFRHILSSIRKILSSIPVELFSRSQSFPTYLPYGGMR